MIETANSRIQTRRFAITVALIVFAHSAFAATYYVATSGSDSNSGTLSSPFRTIQHAAGITAPGDTVYVRAGVYKEVVTVPSSGSSVAGSITYSSYPGELATIDGTGLSIPNNQWGLITLQDKSYVIVKGFEIRNYTTSKTADAPIGLYIFGAGSNLQILNNHIHNITTKARGCNANALGLAVYGTEAPQSINHLTISGNEIDHLKTGCSESMSLDGNVDTFVVSNNLVHDNNNIGIDAIGFEGMSPSAAYDQARNGEISMNTVYNITSFGNPAYGNQYAADGIYVDGGTNITVEQNLIHNVDLGIEIASEHLNHVASYVIARNNLIYSDTSNGISIGGYAKGVGGTDHCTIVNNTLFENDTKNTGSGELQIQFHATNNVFENNILYATKQGLFVNGFTNSTPDPVLVDYNLYYSSVGASNGTWLWEGKTYTGYSNYLAKTPNDVHSPGFSDPLFISTGVPPNLDLQSTSPAINVGDNLGAGVVGTVDFAGNPRVQNGLINLGAYEQ